MAASVNLAESFGLTDPLDLMVSLGFDASLGFTVSRDFSVSLGFGFAVGVGVLGAEAGSIGGLTTGLALGSSGGTVLMTGGAAVVFGGVTCVCGGVTGGGVTGGAAFVSIFFLSATGAITGVVPVEGFLTKATSSAAANAPACGKRVVGFLAKQNLKHSANLVPPS